MPLPFSSAHMQQINRDGDLDISPARMISANLAATDIVELKCEI
jgi:hypothetical protein